MMFDDPFDDNLIKGLFHNVISLHEEKDLSFDEVHLKSPRLSKGWFELSRLSQEDRIEFISQFWLTKLAFISSQGVFLEEKLVDFFKKVEDIQIYLTQETKTSPLEPHMVYILDNLYFHGGPPASSEAIFNLTKQFESVHFPKDYLAFLEIHDGFSKYMDTGIIKTKEMAKIYLKFQQVIAEEILLSTTGVPITPSSLIPFYESQELHNYQCFYSEWYPDEEMGNVSYDPSLRQNVSYLLEEGFSYPTFISWLISYLMQEIDV